MEISAAVTRSAGAEFTIEPVEIDSPREDEVLVRIVGVGLCHTDLIGTAGIFPMSMPAVFGHEGAGVVEQVGSAVTKVVPGDRVALTFRSCGHCPSCDADNPAYCHSMPYLNYIGSRIDGSKTLRNKDGEVSASFFSQSSFATHALTYERNLVKVPHDVPLEIMGTLGCGIQTGAGAVMRSMACEAGSSLLILGGGAVGLSALLAAVIQGCTEIIVVEPQEARRSLAISLGATQVVDPTAVDVVQAVRAHIPSGVNYAFDTTGLPQILESAVNCLAPRGTLGFVGVPQGDVKLPGTLIQAMQNGFTFKGIIEGDSDPDVFIPQLIDLYRSGRFPFDRLITTYPFSEINRAVNEQHQGLCIKPVLLTGQHCASQAFAETTP